MIMSTVKAITEELDLDVRKFAQEVKELADLEKNSKEKFITGLSIELVRKIEIDYKKIEVNIKKLKKAAKESKSKASKVAVEDYDSKVNKSLLLFEDVEPPVKGDDKFSSDFVTYWSQAKKHQ